MLFIEQTETRITLCMWNKEGRERETETGAETGTDLKHVFNKVLHLHSKQYSHQFVEYGCWSFLTTNGHALSSKPCSTKCVTFHAKRYRLKTDRNTKRKHHFFSVYLKFPFDHSDQYMFREAFRSPDHVQRTNVDCGCTVQVPAGRHPVRRLQAGGHPRK